MASAEHIKSLIRSHCANDGERFFAVALQVAAQEARQGHGTVAREIRDLVDKAKAGPRKVIPFNRELADLVLAATPVTRLSDIILADEKRQRIERVIREYRQQDKLRSHGLSNRRKILLAGPPGTGKTMTASVLAGELGLRLHTILMDKLVTKFMGETSAKLRQIFDIIHVNRAVYLFDEFDAIGAERGRGDDVGEMRRVLNTFLQLIEQDDSASLIVAATNNASILDQALFRRFDDILHYDLPTPQETQHLIANRLGAFRPHEISLATVTKAALGLSHAEIGQACDDAIKSAILSDKEVVTATALEQMLTERRSAYGQPNCTANK